jgi:hypothetical protein
MEGEASHGIPTHLLGFPEGIGSINTLSVRQSPVLASVNAAGQRSM